MKVQMDDEHLTVPDSGLAHETLGLDGRRNFASLQNRAT